MLAELDEYIREESEIAADNYIDGLHESLSKLEKHPESCAPCRNKKLSIKGYRCCIYKNHITVYIYEENKVTILAIIHSSRSPSSVEDLVP